MFSDCNCLKGCLREGDGFAVFCTEGLSTQRVSVTFPDFKIVARGSKGGFGASDLPHQVEGFEHAFKSIAGVLRAGGRSASGYVRLRWYHDGPGSCGSRQMPWSSAAR